MPSGTTEVTEIATALGMLRPSLGEALAGRPIELINVSDVVWARLIALYRADQHAEAFNTAFANGRAFFAASDGLRKRVPLRVEWKGPHRPPGDDVIPADLRVDHVFLVSCKYLSEVLANSGAPRLFDRLLVGDERSSLNWFAEVALTEFQDLYASAVRDAGLVGMPDSVVALTVPEQRMLRDALRSRQWPKFLRDSWFNLSAAVAAASADRWRAALSRPRDRLKLLWRLLRITTATYFVLGTDRTAHIRLRVDSAWDWMQAYDLRSFEVLPRVAGQPVVDWRAVVRRRDDRSELVVEGHVEIRWSHGRFNGAPEAKVYLDTPHRLVPGYNPLT
jgi:hypothetical protein